MVKTLLMNPLISLFTIIGLGLLLGKLEWRGLCLGSSGVLFVGLLFGHCGYRLPEGIGTVGLVVFVYCVGIGAGSRFFSTLRDHGLHLALLSGGVVFSAVLVGSLLAYFQEIPTDLAIGIFAGALSSTPALAAGLEALGNENSLVTIGYGIAYPFGVIAIVLMVQLLPRWFGVDLRQLGEELDASDPSQVKVISALVQVSNPNLYGQKISEKDFFTATQCVISRVQEEERLRPLKYEDIFQKEQCVLLVGFANKIHHAIEFLGQRVERNLLKDTEQERRWFVVTSPAFLGKSLRELGLLQHFGVVITRMTRGELTLVPTAETVLENQDLLLCVGNPEDLQRFSQAIGHRTQAEYETDLLSFAVGITLGVVVGLFPLSLPGTTSVTLGLAGGPLLVGLLLGHWGRLGRIVGFIPRPTRLLLSELGLVFFLAEAGVAGGKELVATVQTYGIELFFMGAAITMTPLFFALFLARGVWRLNWLQALGGICGGLTSTPALGTLTAKTNSPIPVLSYATAYPVALLFMILFTKAMVEILR